MVEVSKDDTKVFQAMARELDGLGNGVNEPPKHHFSCFPGGITLFHLLDRYWLFVEGCLVAEGGHKASSIVCIRMCHTMCRHWWLP